MEEQTEIEQNNSLASSTKKAKKIKKVKSKKQLRIRMIIILSVLLTVGVFLGNFAGNMIVNLYLNVADFSADESFLIESESTVIGWKSKSIDKMAPVEAFVVAQYNLANSDMFSLVIEGEIVAVGVKQSVYSYNYHIDDEYYCEYISESSMVKVATGYKYNKDKQSPNIKTFRGAVTSATSASWDTYEDVSYEDYKEASGMYADGFIDYIVSRHTIVEAECEALKPLANGNYKFTLSLNNYSAVNYVKKMNYVAGTQAKNFESIKLQVEVDANLNFVTIQVNEKYTALGMGAVSSILQTFDFVSTPTRR